MAAAREVEVNADVCVAAGEAAATCAFEGAEFWSFPQEHKKTAKVVKQQTWADLIAFIFILQSPIFPRPIRGRRSLVKGWSSAAWGYLYFRPKRLQWKVDENDFNRGKAISYLGLFSRSESGVKVRPIRAFAQEIKQEAS
ncbi:MAG: hypothetical protein ACXVCK_14545 [Bdellovibrionota bacterium]